MSGAAGEQARRGRVERVVAAGRRVADADDPVGREARARLLAQGALSREGIALALAEHLETDPSAEDLDALLASGSTAPACHVVLSAHVCTAALRALAVAAATAPRIAVRPSRRDPVVAELLVAILAGDAAFAALGGALGQVATVTPEPGDELHLHGADATLAALSREAGPGVVVRAHGTGLGVALAGAGADLDAAAAALAADVIPFDQRGCLSPRFALVEGDAARARAFAALLHGHLLRLGAAVPRGPIAAADAAALALYRATVEALGEAWEGPHHLVGLDALPRALSLPPAARAVHVVPATAATAPALLAPWARYLTVTGAAGGGPLLDAARALAPAARLAPLGRMQRPPLDGPVDRRPSRS